MPLLTLVHILCSFGLIFIFPQFIYEYSQGQTINFDMELFAILIFLALFIYFSYFVVSLKIEKNETEKEVAEKRKKIPFRWRDLIDKKNQSLGLIDLGLSLIHI